MIDTNDYSREVESYLCRRNRGHLIRVVGPAFELVRTWAELGIPLSVVHRAIDRIVERRDAKPGRRRPVRIEFCEADVLDLFDDWRRAVGVRGRESGNAGERSRASSRVSLAGHLDRVITSLTAWIARESRPMVLRDHAAHVAAELDSLRARAKGARGETRRQLVAHLDEIDRRLADVARHTADPSVLDEVRAQAERELDPFKTRMPAEAFEGALEASANRLIRERLELPRVAFHS